MYFPCRSYQLDVVSKYPYSEDFEALKFHGMASKSIKIPRVLLIKIMTLCRSSVRYKIIFRGGLLTHEYGKCFWMSVLRYC